MDVVSTETGNNSYLLRVTNASARPDRIDDRKEAQLRHGALKTAVLGLAAQLYTQMKTTDCADLKLHFMYPETRVETIGKPIGLSVELPKSGKDLGLLNFGGHQFRIVDNQTRNKRLYSLQPMVVMRNDRNISPELDLTFISTGGINTLNGNIDDLYRRSVAMEAASMFLAQQLQARSEGVGK